jgi:hypothetical protein
MKNLKSFRDSYKACYEEMSKDFPKVLRWLKNFILLFFLPVVYPIAWLICYFKEKENE